MSTAAPPSWVVVDEGRLAAADRVTGDPRAWLSRRITVSEQEVPVRTGSPELWPAAAS